jgi:hypothetical protein
MGDPRELFAPLVLAIAGCSSATQGSEAPASPPLSSTGGASTASAATPSATSALTTAPSAGAAAQSDAAPTASAASATSAAFPLSWNCDAPPEPSIESTPLSDVVRFPVEGSTLAEGELERRGIQLTLPKLRTEALARVALDHLPSRPAARQMTLTSLLGEWHTLTPGTHRLVVFWLDSKALPVRTSKTEPLLAVRNFHVVSPAPLPLADWVWVSPVGTLNGPTDQTHGFPRGLSLIHFGERSAEVGLRVSATNRGLLADSSSAREASIHGEFGPAVCSVTISESRDYEFELHRGDERVKRTVTVNLDLAVAPAP